MPSCQFNQNALCPILSVILSEAQRSRRTCGLQSWRKGRTAQTFTPGLFCSLFTVHCSLFPTLPSPLRLPPRRRQYLRQPFLPIRERARQLPPHHRSSNPPKHAVRQFELDRIAHQRPLLPVPDLLFNPVAMLEHRERPTHLRIAEMAVPLKLRDACQPAHAPRHPRYWIKADQNLRSHASSHAEKSPRGLHRNRPRRRRLNPRILDPRLQIPWHQVREIRRIGKERKHQFHRIRHPMLCLEPLRHCFDGIALRSCLAASRFGAVLINCVQPFPQMELYRFVLGYQMVTFELPTNRTERKFACEKTSAAKR